MGQDKLNGSGDLLAKAMRQVFKEAVEEDVSIDATPDQLAEALLRPALVIEDSEA